MKYGLLAMLCALLVPGYALCCSCVPPSPPLDEFARSDLVFSGHAVAVVSRPDRLLSDGTRPPPNIRISGALIGWTFAVDHVWKGVPADTLVVYTREDEAACGFVFHSGASYLVYAVAVPMSRLARRFSFGHLVPGTYLMSTGLCSRTALLDSAAEDLAALPEPEWPRAARPAAGHR